MSRFTDEKKWSDKWFRSLSSSDKLVWIYLCDNCDIAGFYELDDSYIAFHTGLDVDIVRESIKALSRGYLGAKGSDYIWIKNFLKHQKNHILNSSNNCHKGIIKRIQDKLFYFPSIPEILGANKGLFSPTGKGKGKGKGNGKESLEDQESLEAFDIFRKVYPGTKKGNQTEFDNFRDKHKDWKEVLPDLKDLLDCQVNQRAALAAENQFVPPWKHLSTWINQRCWEEEISIVEKKSSNPFAEGSM